MSAPGAGRRRGRSTFARFLLVCGVAIAGLFALSLVDLAQDAGKPEFVRSNDLTSAMTSAAMLGLVAVAYVRIARVGDGAGPAPGRGPAEPEPRPAPDEANVRAPARARSGRRRRRRR